LKRNGINAFSHSFDYRPLNPLLTSFLAEKMACPRRRKEEEEQEEKHSKIKGINALAIQRVTTCNLRQK
jgi:hypothetical protein